MPMTGMPVTGVVVRSSVNVQSGGRTRLAAILHGVVLTLSALYLGRYISKIPLAALAGLLCVIAVRLIEVSTLVALLIAAVSVTGAVVTWRASVSADGAGDADVAGVRATINLTEGARALAMLRGRTYALPEDMTDLVPDVLRHRLVLSYEALSEGLTADAIIGKITAKIPVPAKPLEHEKLAA